MIYLIIIIGALILSYSYCMYICLQAAKYERLVYDDNINDAAMFETIAYIPILNVFFALLGIMSILDAQRKLEKKNK